MKHTKKKQGLRFLVAVLAALSFVLPLCITLTHSLFSEEELLLLYGRIFSGMGNQFQPVHFKFLPSEFSGEQYANVLLKTPQYLLKFWNSLFLVVPIVVFQLAISCLAAYGFTRCKGKLASLIFFGYIVLMLMPYQVTLVPNYFVISWLNLLDTNWAIWLPSMFAPFSVYLMKRYMQRIPSSIIEAAQMDGAGTGRIFLQIVMPICKGQAATCAFLIFVDYWNMVEQPLILFSDAEHYPLSILLSRIQMEQVGIAFAASVIYMIPVWLFFLYVEDDLVEGMVVKGGIKG